MTWTASMRLTNIRLKGELLQQLFELLCMEEGQAQWQAAQNTCSSQRVSRSCPFLALIIFAAL